MRSRHWPPVAPTSSCTRPTRGSTARRSTPRPRRWRGSVPRPELGTGPGSFGVDFADAPGNPGWRTVLDGIVAAGYRWTELGPLGYLPQDLRPELEARGLGLTAGFVFEPLHDPSHRDEATAMARATAERVARLGGRFLVVIDAVTADRARTAGRPDAARRLAPDRSAAMRATIREIARIAGGYGLRPVLHPHAGTHIEF